ncbi:GTPase-associated system all-helical protein GASH [Bdellovibrio bacteriovorus]|uniref:GTPase-associated system all-helical protein GASH n=1 Tax=Bdellovibrio bacteriovorus TaxID=959 RepID=UPI0035A67E56
MQDIFTEWYAGHDISGNEERLENRLEILEGVEDDEDAPHIFDFFNFYLIKNGDDKSVSEYLTGKVQEYEGETFVVHQNEIDILVDGVILQFARSTNWENKLKTNMLLRILSLQGSLSHRVAVVSEESAMIIDEMSVSNRLVRFGKASLKKEIDSLAQVFKQHSNNISVQGEPVLKAIHAIQSALGSLSDDLLAIREENQLLWWLKSKSLRYLDLAFSDMPPASRIICCSYDVRAMSAYYSPPASARQFVLEAYSYGDKKVPAKISIKSIVEDISTSHANKILEGFEREADEYRHFYPILNSLRIANENSMMKSLAKTKITAGVQLVKLDLTVDQAIELALCEVTLLKLENK